MKMGKRKRGYNWKARQNNETIVERSDEKKIKLDLEVQEEKFDDSNALALPSVKRKTKTKVDNTTVAKKLSKKERKRLQKVLDQKEKKSKRAALFESLSQVQATQDEMKEFSSIADLQSGRFKRQIVEEKKMKDDLKVNVLSGMNKKRSKYEEVVEESSDAESIDTSEISTDEEDEQEDEDDGKSAAKDIGKSPAEESGISKEPVEQDNDGKPKGSQDGTNLAKQSLKNLRKTVNIEVKRSKSVQEDRLKLPILGEEQVIMETINENPVTIICGETGSGKTTQVPQFLYEAGYAHGNGLIGITEPRRVAAIAMSHRVAMEMNLSTSEVSYQIRYEGNVTEDTKIRFMTDGVLLKEVQKDFLLTRYSAIVIDEAHERSVYTDILIGLLSRIVPLREKRGNPLKLIIMSATLRVEDFTENKKLFKITPPVVKVDSRQFPVTIHFNKRTPLDDYLNEAYRKVCKIHRMLPEGGILVFVTGQQEVHTLIRKLKQTFPVNPKNVTSDSKQKKKSRKKKTEQEKLEAPKIDLNNYSVEPVDEEAEREAGIDSDGEDLIDTTDVTDFDDGEDDISMDETAAGGCTDPLYILPLYSLLSTEKQERVFSPPPEGCRLCVVATNVAETSLTIPNIRYVVDTGKVKTKFYDKVTGVSTFKITWTSKASANQRAGRAGRVGPGHCYRLYSSAVFNDDFEKFSPAEITRRPDMNIDKVINFPYPTPPDIEQIKAAENLLISLGALTKPEAPKRFKDTKKEQSTKITPLGRAMSCFPVAPRYAKMLSLGHQHDLLPYVVAIVAALSPDSLKQRLQHMIQVKKVWAGTGHSLLLGDLMVMLKAVGSCEYEGFSPEFCEKHGIRYKAMKEVRKLRAQLTNSVNTVIPEANLCVDPKLEPPSDLQAKLLRQIILAGLGDHVARKCPDPLPTDDAAKRKKLKNAYECIELEEPVYIHPCSVLYRQNPEYVVYQYIHETSKVYMKGIVAIEPEWLPVFAATHCSFSKPLDDPAPSFDEVKGHVVCHMTSTFSRCSWGLPAVQLEYPIGLDKYKWFAQFFLEGKVIPQMKKYSASLLSTPSTMVKTWAKLQPRTESLLNALIKEQVNSKDSLLKAWKKDQNFY
ncbi:hypothetical protein KUTeg_010478 [Tegillarca granosa]|uniref:RNA helicase n=1 Tax=Tegillarca granosa TaxID=220873 RepID=A0ABQ9FA07_TEGGR|nr:hypothetical protein KUTeg_010478 [Tegillarca granosa]